MNTQKVLLLFFILLLPFPAVFPQGTYDYAKKWTEIDSLLGIGLPESADNILNEVFSRAKSDNNTVNYVRASIYKLKTTQYNREDSFTENLLMMIEEEKQAPAPMKQFLNTIIADMYFTYYSQNRYDILERSVTVNFKQEDLKTWDANKFMEKCIGHYKASISEPEKLQQISIENFNELLNNYVYDKYIPNGRKYRPTLYDFLAFRAINFFTNNEAGVTRPAEQFLLNDPVYLSDAREFSGLDISTQDVFSFDYYAISIYRDIIRFHVNDASPDALIDADLHRLNYVYGASSNSEKDKYYLSALENISRRHSGDPATAFVQYYIAQYYYVKGQSYSPQKGDDNKFDIKTAAEICRKTIEMFPEADGTANCRSLLTSIEARDIKITAETFSVPGKPSKFLATYRNINKLYVKAVEITESEIENLSYDYNKYPSYNEYQKKIIGYLNDKSPVQNFSVNLPDDGDYQQHKTEIRIPALPKGLYALMTGTDENFSYRENAVSYCLLNFNNISYISKTADKHLEVYVLNRESGYPMSGATVTPLIQFYDYNKSKYEYSLGESLETDKDGFVKISKVKKDATIFLQIEHEGEELSTRGLNFGYGYSYNNEPFYIYDSGTDTEPRAYERTFFFTDRAIYRPGQTIYFKGLVLSVKGRESEIKPNASVLVQFYDVNYQKISEQTFTSNDFGTFNGTFTAPQGVLNGQMHIQTSDNTGSIYFSVEDYKRPKFEVTFEPIKGSYKLNEMVSVKGIAKSYSGANLDNAKVKYRVARRTYFPRWFYYGYYDFYSVPNEGEVEVTNGTTVTDVNGGFEISFKAIPDMSVPKKFEPYFTFEVIADVTDINNETQSNTASVYAGYKSLILNADIPDNVNKNAENRFRIITTNLNGQKESVEGKITIHKLKSPDKVFRKRLWDKPDKFVYTKDEFYRDFPADEYDDETDFTKWEKEVKAFEMSFNSESDSVLDLSAMKGWNQGKYVVEMEAKDKFGEEVKEKIYFNAYSTGETSMPYKSYAEFIPVKIVCEPGEQAELIFGTSLPDTRVLVEVYNKEDQVKREWMTVSDAQRFLSTYVVENYRGNISYNLAFIKYNRLYTASQMISVPFTNRMLDISFETFRNKLTPGQQEEWKIKIKGKNGEKAAAEMLATMYDASLDKFRANSFNFSILNYFWAWNNWSSKICFTQQNSNVYHENLNKSYGYYSVGYDYLNWFGAPVYSSYGNMRTGYYDAMELDGRGVEQEELMVSEQAPVKTTDKKAPKNGKEDERKKKEVSKDGEKGKEEDESNLAGRDKKDEFTNVVARSDFRETAFFYPDLKTDENGELTISFTMPDALTKWKMLGFAHTKDLKHGFVTNELVTQKDLMVTPNVPRYFREDDKVVISAKINNLSERDLNGSAVLFLYDATDMKTVDAKFKNEVTEKVFEVKRGQSASVEWEIAVPYGFEAIDYKIVAKADNFSDGEESVLPVLSNRMLVTETMPMHIRGNQTKTFSMNKLVNASSNTMTNYNLTLEFTSNPAWYAVQSMPYLMEFPYECAEQVFSRFYANSIATHLVNSSPKIKDVFDKWKNEQPEALMSNLEKNQELKSLILQETPWVLQAKNESERKRRIGTLFQLNIMRMELDRALRKLKSMQVSNGAWPWFEGMPEDRYITQHIVAGMGKLNKLGIYNLSDNSAYEDMVYDAIGYIDNRISDDYRRLLELEKEGYIKLSDNNLGNFQAHYLYTRSFFKDLPVADENKEAFNYYKSQAEKYWLDRGWYTEGLIALALKRFGNDAVPANIVKSLKENSLKNEELGMYWKYEYGWYWYEAPIETQALMIEVFDEVANDMQSVDDMKVWLLKNKQTNDWKTTKATVEAIYALMLRGDDWLATEDLVDITVGAEKIDLSKTSDIQTQAGTGYFTKTWKWGEIKNDMGNVTVTRKSSTGISWGALYWQYFENLDKITKSETNLKIDKKLFLEQNTPSGPVITPVESGTVLKPGDMIKVRIEIRVDRDMEYVHMKDMRAAGFEPVNVISQYKYRDGLGYYESTRDAATNFFFGFMPKGTYVFEYPLRVSLPGDYSNGITSIQCMYAPEFTSNSEGVRVRIER